MILDGKKWSAIIYEELKERVQKLKEKGITPGLATVLVGDDPASHVYVGQKIKKCELLGIKSIHKALPAKTTKAQLLKTVDALNKDPEVHGMIVQLPLPKTIDPEVIIRSIDPAKDADGLHPLNQGIIGRLKSWEEIKSSHVPLPCTPAGIIELLLREKIPVSGKHAVVVGRSTLVGKPVSQLLLSLNATVTMAHSGTENLVDLCRSADILVAALGKPEFLRGEAVKPGAVVIDVGISRTVKGLLGDVKFDEASQKASWITPVPGGVGLMTVCMLLSNTVRAAELKIV